MTENQGFSEAEKAAMKERAKELRGKNKVDPLEQLLEAISKMSQADQKMAKKIHALVTKHAPDLKPKTWYGMPAYANKAGKALIFFQAASKFDSRLATFGITEHANIDNGKFWPTSWSLTEIDQEVEKQLVMLISLVATQHQQSQE